MFVTPYDTKHTTKRNEMKYQVEHTTTEENDYWYIDKKIKIETRNDNINTMAGSTKQNKYHPKKKPEQNKQNRKRGK